MMILMREGRLMRLILSQNFEIKLFIDPETIEMIQILPKIGGNLISKTVKNISRSYLESHGRN